MFSSGSVKSIWLSLNQIIYPAISADRLKIPTIPPKKYGGTKACGPR
jgi:hypothetical protein